MAELVINNSATSVRLEGGHLLVTVREPEPRTARVPLSQIERVVVVGRPAVSFPVLARLMDDGIPCAFLSRRGRWRGSFNYDRGHHAGRRMRQYARTGDPGFCLGVARELVRAKIKNARRVVQRVAAGRDARVLTDDIRACVREMEAAQKRAEGSPDLETLRGQEGIAAAAYFRAYGAFLAGHAEFTARSRRPPRDPVNALLSWTYTVLLDEFVGALRAHGLDAAAGVLHQGRDTAPALALDLMEPFRPGCADLLTLNLLSHRIARADEHFERRADGGVYLNEAGRKVFFEAYEKAMTRPFSPAQDAPRTTLRQAVDRQVCEYLRALEQGGTPRFFILP